jgi:hypothetical protein
MNKKRFPHQLLAAATLVGITPNAVAAASSTPTASVGLWIAFAIAYLTRKRAVGGWLSYYYFQLYLSIVATALITGIIGNLSASGWEDKAMYSLFLISVVPYYLLKAAECVIASAILVHRFRSKRSVNFLRYILLAQGAALVLALFIDYNHFPDDLFLTGWSFGFAFIWFLYFTDSRRVDWVLVHPEWQWNYESFRQKTPKNTS